MPDTGLSNSLRTELDKVARAHRILEMEGHGDKTLGHMSPDELSTLSRLLEKARQPHSLAADP